MGGLGGARDARDAMHPTAEKFSALYEELKGDIEGLVVKKEKQEAELAERQRQLGDLQASIDDITKRFEAERNEIAGDRQEFEEFKAEALQQLENWRDKLEAEKREFAEASAEARAVLDAESAQLKADILSFEEDRKAKEVELTKIAAQLDEERAEFEGYRSASQAELERQLEAAEADRKRLKDEREKFEAFRVEATESISKEQERLDAERNEFESMKTAIQHELSADRDELAKALLEFERSRDEERAVLGAERSKVEGKQLEQERLQEELVNMKWKLARERRHYDDDRKQLAKLLLTMGEKISTADSFGGSQDAFDDDLTAQKELPVYEKALGESNLLGTVPIYSSSTVGDVRAHIADKFSLTPTMALKRRGTPIKGHDNTAAAIDFFRPGDYLVTDG